MGDKQMATRRCYPHHMDIPEDAKKCPVCEIDAVSEVVAQPSPLEIQQEFEKTLQLAEMLTETMKATVETMNDTTARLRRITAQLVGVS
jgi:hypothetical protein